MASIARKNLFEDIPRFLVAQAGIMFAVSLVTIQLGILKGFSRSTAIVIDHARADLWVTSKEMVYFELTSALPADYLTEAEKVVGVDRAEVLLLRSGRWRDANGKLAPVRIFGFNPEGQLFAGWQVLQGKVEDLKQPYTVMLDQDSRRSLGINQVSSQGSIGFLPATAVGFLDDVQSNASSPFLFASLETANAYGTAELSSSINCTRQSNGELNCTNRFQNRPLGQKVGEIQPPARLNLGDPITYILIRAKPGENLDRLKQRLREALPATEVYTQREMAALTRNYWEERTGVGFILGLGAAVGFIVGMVVVGQILYSSVADHMREFGTLKAMGASNWVIYRVIIEQALWMSILGYIPSILLCVGLGHWTQAAKGVMILIEPTTAAGVFVLTVVMCIGSALFAVQKVTRVDPAIVFKA
ncbi:FtsX-like permease family protein [Alkalinema sp. FACHB-956]|uniref:FtsX-like permease family protein n=1 Tax=Alkalinema sp. FACHB-956 TaxID=2692768 RepID=UPI00168292BC|nr:FtsX-like permease family protein [Alkalinema sp. FACHB-956]MBD2326228.1 ABC transporter permease [Alkalinema sp. FACHB-956]